MPEESLEGQGITAVVPCYNEVECIQRAYEEISAELVRYRDAEIIFVDDGSTDGTLDLIRSFAATDLRVKFVSFSRNFGLESAFSAGFKYASKHWTVQLDADLQSPPAELHRLLAKALEGYDVVFAVREDRDDPLFRRLGSVAQHVFARNWLGIQMPRGASVFRVIRTSVAKKVVATRVSTPYFIATVSLIGARYTTMPTSHRPRVAGRAKWNIRRLIEHSMDLFTGFSYRPLAVTYLLSALAAVLGFGAFVLVAFGLVGSSAGLALSLLLISGTAAGVAGAGRYVMRVLRGQGGTPRYLIREANIPIAPADDLYEYEQHSVCLDRSVSA